MGGGSGTNGNNARNLSLKLSLSQLAKMLCLSYYCLSLLFNKIRAKGRTGSAWKPRRGSGTSEGKRWKTDGRNGPNNVCTCE
jgi:hypothetical protein